MHPEEYSIVAAHPSTSNVGIITPIISQIHFTGRLVNSISPEFTVGGWVRFVQTSIGCDQVIFDAGNFVLGVNSQGTVTTSFGGTPTSGAGAIGAILDTAWHFVAVTFKLTDSSRNFGDLRVYLDGMSEGGAGWLEMPHTTVDQSICTLGAENQSAYLEFATWEIWEKALPATTMEVPEWGVPDAQSPESDGLVVAFDFASAEIASSNPNYSFTSTGRKTVRPCLSMKSTGFATTNPDTTFAVGNSGPWSLLTWLKVPNIPGGQGQFIPYLCGKTGFAHSLYGENPVFKLEVNIVGEEQTIEVIRSQLPKKPEVFISVKWDLTSWTHVALTFDTNVIKLYINGNLVQSSGPVPAGPVIVNSTIALCLPFSYNQNGGWPGSLQSMSIWNRLIGADELEKCTRWIEPDTPGLQAFFPLLTHATDTVKGLNLDLTNGAIANDEEIVAGGTTAYRKPQEQSDVLSQDVAEGTLLQPKDYWSLAAKHGINIETRNIKDCLEDEDLAELYGSSYFSVAEPARSRMITEFDRSFRLGKELCQQDIKTGKIEARFENGSTVFYYHTVKGPEEIYREDLNLTPLEIWIITIIADVLFVVLSVVGLSTTPGVVKSATSRGARLSRLVPQISASLQNIGPGPSGIVAFAGNVVNILNDAGTLFSIFWNIVTASWWSIIFVCVSLIASVLAIVLFPASAGWRFFNVGVALTTLGYDLKHKP